MDATHYRRTENGQTTVVTVRDAMAEISHAQMDGKRQVAEMSSGRTRHEITYTDGRHVVLVPADEPQKSVARVDAHCTSIRGGVVHTNRPVGGEMWPECRTGAQDSRGTLYVPTTAALTCRNCIEQERRRDAKKGE